MKILHINTSTSGGGAAKSAYELHTGLKGLNIESNMLVSALDDSEIKKDRVFALGNNYKKFLYAGFTLLTGYDSYNYPLLKKKLCLDLVNSSDIIHIHNLHGYYFNIYLLKHFKKKVVILTVRDFWIISGSCAFFLECEKWLSGCGSCPDISRYPKSLIFDRSKFLLTKKKQILSEVRPHIVCPSKYVYDVITNSYLKSYSKTIIYNGINEKKFKNEVGKKIDDNICMFLIVSNFNKGSRKNIDHILKIFSKISKHKYKLRIIGNVKNSLIKNNINCNFLGYINDDQALSKYYSESDYFINLSKSETFGRTTVESLLCGTPVIALNIPVMREIIGNYGFFVDEKSENIKELIQSLCENKITFDKEKVRKQGLKFSFNNTLNKYVNLYKKLTS